jgi:hypothetical protein
MVLVMDVTYLRHLVASTQAYLSLPLERISVTCVVKGFYANSKHTGNDRARQYTGRLNLQ